MVSYGSMLHFIFNFDFFFFFLTRILMSPQKILTFQKVYDY